MLVYSGSSATGTAVRTLSTVAGLDGSYAVAPSDPLPNGTYTAQARQSDLAGNTGASTANTFTVAVAVPAPPTNLSPPTISGTAQQGQMLSELARRLIPFERMLAHRSFLLENLPRFIDFDLYGMLADFLYSGHYELPAAHTQLKLWYEQMARIQCPTSEREKLHS